MGMTAVEKILARASALPLVRPGDFIEPVPDLIMIHDNHVMATKNELDSLGIDRLFDPDRVVMVSDHDVIYVNERAIERGAFNRKAAQAWGVRQFHDVGRGGHGHVFPTETGLITPGTFYFDNDRHCTNAGGVGAVALRVGEEMSTVLATGTVWVKVPESIRITLRGTLRPGVMGRDLGFVIARMLKQDGIGCDIDYRVVEFAGDLDQITLANRVAMCGTPTEIGAVAVYFPPSAAVIEHATSKGLRAVRPTYSDTDAKFVAELALDVSAIEPQIALPGGVQNAVNVSEAAGTPVQHAFIGSCGSGMWDDLVAAAAVLKGHRVAPGVRLFVTPGSEYATRRLHTDGLLSVFQEAGALMIPAGCGACAGGRTAPVFSGEVSISTAVNNGAGRMGAKDAKLYLGNPATVAASAVTGKITDPRELMTA